MKKLLFSLFIFHFSFFTSFAQDEVPAARNFRLKHVEADLTLNPYNRLLKGKAVFTVSALTDKTDSLVFVTPGMNIHSVLADGKPARNFIQENGNLTIFPAQILLKNLPLKLEIVYDAVSPKELHFTGWDDPTGRMRKQVWAHRPHGWIPFADQMATQELRITFDKHFKLVANGERIKTLPSGDTATTWTYRLDKPHPFYSVCLVAGDFDYRSSKTAGGTPLELWYYPEYAARFDETYRLQKEMFDFFEKEIRVKYPYSLYRNIPVADYLYGAMETTTSTVYADFMQVDKRGFFGRNFVNTNAHELAHQWFGNCINDKTVKDLWLTESFATYYAKIFEKSVYGNDQYEFVRDVEFQKAYKIAGLNSFPLGSGKAGTERWYQKGSLVMDMLRDVLGDADFTASIKAYMEQNAYQEAESNDLLKAIYETTGKPLDWFFRQWVYNGGEPVLKVSWKDLRNKNARFTQLQAEQILPAGNSTGIFKLPVNIEVYYKDGQKSTKLAWLEKQTELIDIPNPGNLDISFVVFDAGNRLLKTLKFERSYEELSAQALGAAHLADRLEAVRALKSFPIEQKRQCLTKVYSQEKFQLIKSEIVPQLASDSLSIPLINNAIHDPDALVRKAVLDNVKAVPASLWGAYENMLKDSAYFNVETALINLVNTFNSDAVATEVEKKTRIAEILRVTKDEVGWRGRNIRIVWLGASISTFPERKENLTELIDYCSPAFDFETRTNALLQLRRLNYLDSTSAQYLLKAADYWNYKLANVAKELVTWFSQQEQYSLLRGSQRTGKQ
jgi:aminopeptidase N